MRNLKFSIYLGLAVVMLATPSSLAAATIFITTLGGANEVPPTGSTGTGNSTVTLNGNTLTVSESFSGLIGGPAAAAHIHCCGPVGVNEPVAVPFTGFPTATSGTYNQSFDLTLLATYTGAFVTASGGTAALAEATLIASLNAGQTYANIHNAQFPGGEIRGQLLPQVVPEPATGLLLLALAPILAVARKRLNGR
jgi:CHRD domain